MRRGEVWLTRFDDSIGGEIQKTRPAIIVSNDYVNEMLNRVQIIPTSRRIERIYPTEISVRIGTQTSKALVDQIATADKHRLLRWMAVLSAEDMMALEHVIKIQLGLS